MFKLEKLDPRTKILIVVELSTAAMIVKNVWMLAVILAFTIALLAVGGVGFTMQLRQGRMAIGMVVFLFILQTIFGNIELGALLCVRLMIVIMSALILLTSQTRDYLLGLVQWKVPYEIAYMLMIGLHFFPILREEALDVYYSIQLRGAELKHISLRRKLAIYLKISLPILAGAMVRAKETSISMEARGFRSYPRRTYMRRIHFKIRDIVWMVVFPLLVASFVLWGSYGLNHIDMPSQIILSQSGSPSESQAVSWYGDSEYEGIVEFGENNDDYSQVYATVVEVRPKEYYRYKAIMKGLKPSTKYYYRVGNGHTWSLEKSFVTAPEAVSTSSVDKQQNNVDTSILFMGDVQYEIRDKDYITWSKLLQKAYSLNPNIGMAVMSGDMVEKSGDIQDWTAFFSASQSVFSEIPLAAVPGNHETSIIPYTYMQMLPQVKNGQLGGEFYSFDYGNVHFVMLNSCFFMEERIQNMGKGEWIKTKNKINTWIKNDLSNSNAKWKIALMHHPLYPIEEDDEIYSRMRDNWESILQEGGVELVLCGHQHVYMRTKAINGITYVMGNSGQKRSYYYKNGMTLPDYVEHFDDSEGNWQIINITAEKLQLKSFDMSGEQIDAFTLE